MKAYIWLFGYLFRYLIHRYLKVLDIWFPLLVVSCLPIIAIVCLGALALNQLNIALGEGSPLPFFVQSIIQAQLPSQFSMEFDLVQATMGFAIMLIDVGLIVTHSLLYAWLGLLYPLIVGSTYLLLSATMLH